LVVPTKEKFMSIRRKATAVWNGSGKEGIGQLSTQSTVLHKTQYSFSSRFESGIGTNPEELVAAAHAGCFTMKLSFVLGEAGFTPEELKTDCMVTLDSGNVTQSHLVLQAKVPGISKEKFDECVKNAEVNCPISKLLKTAITVEARLL
jgi:osmotically inducible protein OsmC